MGKQQKIHDAWISGEYEEMDRLQSCENKIDYKSAARAEKSAKSMAKKTGKYFESYECRHCKGFHIGKRIKGELTSTHSREIIRFHIGVPDNAQLPNLGIWY